MTDGKKIILSFFQAENNRNWAVYQSFLTETVQWHLFQQEEEHISGKSAYLERIQGAYQNSDITFHVLRLEESPDHSRVAAILENTQGEVSWEIFQLEQGLIVQEWEFSLE